MTQNILAILIVFIAGGITIYSVIKTVISKKEAHCDGCPACRTNKQNKPKINTFKNQKDIKYDNLIFDNRGK